MIKLERAVRSGEESAADVRTHPAAAHQCRVVTRLDGSVHRRIVEDRARLGHGRKRAANPGEYMAPISHARTACVRDETDLDVTAFGWRSPELPRPLAADCEAAVVGRCLD